MTMSNGNEKPSWAEVARTNGKRDRPVDGATSQVKDASPPAVVYARPAVSPAFGERLATARNLNIYDDQDITPMRAVSSPLPKRETTPASIRQNGVPVGLGERLHRARNSEELHFFSLPTHIQEEGAVGNGVQSITNIMLGITNEPSSFAPSAHGDEVTIEADDSGSFDVPVPARSHLGGSGRTQQVQAPFSQMVPQPSMFPRVPRPYQSANGEVHNSLIMSSRGSDQSIGQETWITLNNAPVVATSRVPYAMVPPPIQNSSAFAANQGLTYPGFGTIATPKGAISSFTGFIGQPHSEERRRILLFGPLRIMRLQASKFADLRPIASFLEMVCPPGRETVEQWDPFIPNVVYTISYVMTQENYEDYLHVLSVFKLAEGVEHMLSVGPSKFDTWHTSQESHITSRLFLDGLELDELLRSIVQHYDLGILHSRSRIPPA
ncbi:hypothetical protein BS50DRAFT_645780 [Corynespora cassiicola Philippines]|uniref:Uncharacterized protein n=1 Tax=Corynespora cassiicola Philippines TaxID=1448308 RepID=A0A2T2NJA6_CORCC|nr:hypothetical protein BS50DRAFT_645780 [Corynespora cassiicola Philippines]